jgi:protein arginine kinase
VGTGLRVSALMHLGALTMLGELRNRLKAAHDLGVAVRGAFGEGSQAAGDFYQVSNEVTLGFEEGEIVQKVLGVAQYLLGEERQARKELLSTGLKRLLESASKSLRVLSSSMGAKPQQALALMSPLRLVAEAGYAEGCSLSLMNELMLGLRVGAGDEGRANISRATMLRRKLDGVRIIDV